MKLYVPPTPSGITVPSLWTAASYPMPATDASYGYWTYKLSDSKVLPVYLLTQYPSSTRTTVSFSGGGTQGSNKTVRDYIPEQMAVFGVKLGDGGTIPFSGVWPNSWLATSGYATMTYGAAAIQGLAFIPAFIYVYRPSTQTVVGVLAAPDLAGHFGSMVSDCVSHVRPGGAGGTGAGQQWYTYITDFNRGHYWTRSNVTGALAGDYLFYEFWISTMSQSGSLTKSWSWNVDVGWNGTTSTDQIWNTNSTTSHVQNSFFYWDDLSVTTGLSLVLPQAGSVNLTNVDPGSGPSIRLTFDGDVSSASTAIGSASSGVGVTSVSQVGSTTVDLNLAVRPSHPLGEAESNPDLAPPSGGGAFQL